jgi:hypothetical protein
MEEEKKSIAVSLSAKWPKLHSFVSFFQIHISSARNKQVVAIMNRRYKDNSYKTNPSCRRHYFIWSRMIFCVLRKEFLKRQNNWVILNVLVNEDLRK